MAGSSAAMRIRQGSVSAAATSASARSLLRVPSMRLASPSTSGRPQSGALTGKLTARDTGRAKAIVEDTPPCATRSALVLIRDGAGSHAELGANATPDQVAAAFVLLLSNSKCQALDLNHNSTKEEYILRIMASFFALNRTLKALILEDCMMGVLGATTIATGLARNRSLVQLNLSGANLGDAGMQTLATALGEHKTLEVLALENNNIRDTGLAALSGALRKQKTLKELYIGSNTFSFDRGLFHDEFMGQSVHAGASFASAVQHHPALTTLDLSYNNNSLGESLQYITDALKFNTRITTVGMRGVVLTSEAILCLGELMLATPTLPRVVDLTESGLDGNLNPLVTALRTLPHQYDLVGVDFGNVPIVAEMAAHLRMVAKLLSRPTVVTMPSDLKRTDIFLLDGRQCVIDWEEGKFSKGRLVYANFDYLDFTTIRNRGLMRDGTPDMNLIGTFTMEESTPTINLPKIAAVSSSIVNVADYVMDIIVLVDLYAAGVKAEDFTLFAASLAILLFANIYTMYSLVQDGRSRAAILQPLSLTIVMDAYNFVCLGKVTGAIMPLRTTQPMQGLAAIHRLKLTEAMMEATPQTLLQSFQALKLLDPNPILIVSIALSLGSIVASLAQSDKAKMNAWRKSEAQKQVTYVTFGVLLAAAFRAAEIASNVVTVSLFAVFFSEAPAFYLYLGGLLGIKVLFTCFYWRFNFKHFGDVATSLFVFPGSDEVCLEWIKDVQRLPTSFYILVQVAADGVALTLMATMQDSLMVSSTDADRKSTYTNFFVVAIAVVVLKYILAGAMSAAHHYFPDFLYTDRRHQLSCGQVGRKNSDVGDTLLDATAARQKQQQPVKNRGASPSVVGEVPNPLRVDHPVNRGATLSPTAKSPPGGGSDAGAKLSGYRSNTARRMSLSTKRKAEAKATSPKGTEQHEDFEASTAWMRGPAEEAEAAKTTSRRGQKSSGKKGGALPPARAASRSAAVSGGASAGAGGKASKKAYRRQSVAVSVQQAAQARFLSERSARVAKDLISDVDVDEL